LTTPTKRKILIVDDDARILRTVKAQVENLGYEANTASDGRAALALARTLEPDLVILDVSLDDSRPAAQKPLDGIEVLRRLRDASDVPVLMLSATNVAVVKVMALSLGADDYLTKPFEPTELAARIEAILRRVRKESPDDRVLSFQRVRLDTGARRIWKDGELVELTGIEFDILHALARRPGHVFTREKLIEAAWKGEYYGVAKAVDVHIGHIRKKLEDDPAHPTLVATVRGTGYRFEDTQIVES
jgi:DNA-binding response OmpR family regulator